jgi:AraC-like DNA-binding protein
MPPWIMKRHAAESGAAAAICRIRESVGVGVRPVAVSFQHPEPDDTDEHQRIFDCPLSFGQSRNELVIRAEDLELPVRDAHPELCRIFEAQAEQLLASIGRGDEFISGVRRAIFDSLSGGEASVKGVAGALGLEPEQLRERLARRDTSFRAMLSAIRRDLAETYLQDRQWAMMDIAFVLGFGDTSSFARTFKSWTGTTPTAYRKLLFDRRRGSG